MNVDNLPEAMKKDAHSTLDQRVDRQMARLGYKPEDVKYVILSHMYVDHVGGMTLFPHATFIVRKEELRMAWWPETYEGRAGGREPQGGDSPGHMLEERNVGTGIEVIKRRTENPPNRGRRA